VSLADAMTVECVILDQAAHQVLLFKEIIHNNWKKIILAI
jgi:hypothetical protein